ncbi:MAG: YihY/virulence factor BrkB family protein [Bacteroidales bacterium]|nr:YihY/virulence factor BrkB family protein [Bacteroidales bacterium]
MKKILQTATKYIKHFIKRLIQHLLIKLNHIHPPGFQGHSLYKVGNLFLKGLMQGFVTERAASVAFSFFTALFPLLLFSFTLIPYIPIENFQDDLLNFFHEIIPPQIWDVMDETVTYIITRKSGNLLSISVVLSLYFGTNGINSLFTAFRQTYHRFTNASNWLKNRLYSLIILTLIFVLLSISVVVLGMGKYVLNIFRQEALISGFLQWLFNVARLAIAIFTVMIAVATFYFFGSSRPHKFRIFTPGTITSTALIALTTMGFNYYITNFSRYNILYGSLGTILILTFYLYVNAVFILIGFEINTSIRAAAVRGRLREKEHG